MAKKAAFLDTPLHATLRLGLINALEERDWRVAELARQTRLAHSTISDFLNGTQGIGVDSLNRCLTALRLSPKDFLERCDLSWRPERLQGTIEGDATHAPSHSAAAQIRAAIDTLRAATEVAATLIAGQTGPTETAAPQPLRRRHRAHRPPRS